MSRMREGKEGKQLLIDITKIIVKDRIRKDIGNIDELAADIKENSLLNPITVIPSDDGMYQLIAGERRLTACKSLGYTSIVANTVSAKDAEHALRMEISENENRKEFTFSERMDYAKRLEQIERLKADERMKDPRQNFAQGETGRTSEKVSAAVGFGNKETYRQAKFITDNADYELIKALDDGKLSINGAYQQLKTKLKEAEDKAEKAEAELRRIHENKDIDSLKCIDFDLKETEEILNSIEAKPVVIVPDDYEQVKKNAEVFKNELERVTEQNNLTNNQNQILKRELQNEKGLKHDLLNIDDFRFDVGVFIGKVGKFVYLAEAFSLLDSRQRTDFEKQVNIIDLWVSDVREAIKGNIQGGKTIILEGGYKDE